MKTLVTHAIAIAIAIAGASLMVDATAAGRPEPAFQASELAALHDFDFLAGSWQIRNWRLKRRHSNSKEWLEFPGGADVRQMLGGAMNVDETRFPRWSGSSIRLFDMKTRQWSIYWVSSRDGILQAPVVGGFKDGVGEFLGDDTDDGVPIRARFRWTHDGVRSAHWEQAYSWDGGLSWETNWTMDFTRP